MSTRANNNRVIDGDFRPLSANQSASESHIVNQSFNPLGIPNKGGVNLANPLGNGDALGAGMLSSVINVRQGDSEYVGREKGFLSSLFGKTSERDKRLAQHDLNQTNQVCGFLEKKLALECEAIYLRCQDDVNNWLTRHRLASRRDLITFATLEMEALKNSLEERREGFTAYLRRRIHRLDCNSDMQLLVQAEVEDIKTELAEHLKFLHDLEVLFREAVHQRIG